MSTPTSTPGSPEFLAWLHTADAQRFMASLATDDVEALGQLATSEMREAGSVLFRLGEPPSAMFIIEQGEAELVYETRYERLVIQILGRGSTIGDLAVMLGTPHAYSAVARTDVSLLRFDLATIEVLIAIYPSLCFRWLRLIARRLDRAQRRLIEVAGKSTFEQLVHFLVHEVADRDSLTFSLTQKEIAESLGVSRQAVSRALRDLEAQKLVERARGQVHIRDLERLQNHVPR